MNTLFNNTSEPITVWIRSIGECQEKTIHRIIDLLAQQGINVQDYCNSCANSGIIISNKATPEILEQLCELSHNGQNQVLACFQETVPGEVIWQGSSFSEIGAEVNCVVLMRVKSLC